MNTRNTEKTAIFALDYDQCAVGFGANTSNYRSHIMPLVKHIKRQIIDGNYEKVRIISMSGRISAFIDWWNNRSNRTLSSFDVLPKIAIELKNWLKEKNIEVLIEFDTTLLSDFHGNVDLGTNFNLVDVDVLTHPRIEGTRLPGNLAFNDSSKFIQLCTIMQYLSTKIDSDDHAHLYYYDDQGNNILKILSNLFKENTYLVPDNITFKAIEFNSRYGYINTQYPSTTGTGKPCKTIEESREKSLALLLNCLAQHPKCSKYTKRGELRTAEHIHKLCAFSAHDALALFTNDFFPLNIDNYIDLFKTAKDNNELDACITQSCSTDTDTLNSHYSQGSSTLYKAPAQSALPLRHPPTFEKSAARCEATCTLF